ncbi:hypothetical protein [Streptomyces sp. NPDC005970]|uniref:hypothetical protein n=1 Tax=Streptomyces sp. NPDC005970 TaxID=3156723 RepID=UPI0033C8425C
MKPHTPTVLAVTAGARLADIQWAWRTGRAAEVPIGVTWGVTRVTRTIGTAVLHRLRARGTPLGLVLEVPLRATVEFLVPPGCSASWPPLTGTRCVASGMMRWPSPGANLRTGVRAACGRRWIVEPNAADVLTTDGDELCEAVAATLARFARAWLADRRTEEVGRGPVRRVS